MRILFLLIFLFGSLAVYSQEERDTTLNRCPVYITDTVSNNNFFLEARPCTLRVYRVKGDLTVVVEQREQFLTLFFNEKRLKTGKYRIDINPRGKSEMAIKYSFRSDGQASYVSATSGTVEVTHDKESDLWKLKVNGLIPNLVERNITYYRVRSSLTLK